MHPQPHVPWSHAMLTLDLHRLRALLLLAAWIPIAARPAHAQSPAKQTPPTAASPLILEHEIDPRGNFSKAAFRFWSPESGGPIRGLVVLVPGANGDGRKKVYDPGWQAFARSHRLALVACFLQGDNYHDATGGTGDALLEAIAWFAGESSHPELALNPLLLYGESAGGQFNYNFAFWKPARVVAFVVNKGGFYNHEPPTPPAYAIPGLFILGQDDEQFRIDAITGKWTEGRRRGALWALAPQPHSGHEFSRTAALAQVFFDAVLQVRLPNPAAGAAAMQPMHEAQGWLGDLTTHTIHSASSDPQPGQDAAWLPDEASAVAWKAFVTSDGPLPRN
jgi:hypothetical protein